MKHTYKFDKPLVQGNVNDITKDEIRVVEQPDGTIDLQERKADGNFQSKVKGGKVANVDKPLYAHDNLPKDVNAAINIFLDRGTEDGAAASKTFITDVNLIRDYLPERQNVMNTPCNLIGFVGCKNEDGGFELATLDWYLKVAVEENNITVTKHDSTE